MNLSDPLDLTLAIALCAIAWAAPVLWLFVGPLLFANVAFSWIFGGRP